MAVAPRHELHHVISKVASPVVVLSPVPLRVPNFYLVLESVRASPVFIYCAFWFILRLALLAEIHERLIIWELRLFVFTICRRFPFGMTLCES